LFQSAAHWKTVACVRTPSRRLCYRCNNVVGCFVEPPYSNMSLALKVAAGGAAACLGAYALFNPFGATATTAAPEKPLKNQAFVFVKPHAVTDKVNALVRDELKSKGITILEEGELTSEVIDEKKLIDQHYYAIASKATILTPDQMNVPEDKFKSSFGIDWKDAMQNKKVYNALDACKALNVSTEKMAELWAKAKKENKLVKFGGGFYCGEINYDGKKLYVFNGFFMEMRNAFTAPGKKIHYYSVEWDPSQLSWADFRGKVLGPTDPKEAPKESLRGRVLKEWKSLGLKSEPNVGDNAVHASASPFEGMAERMNWLGTKCSKDAFCSALVRRGIPEDVIVHWSRDPQVAVEGGKKKSLFDTLEDQDAPECAKKAKELYALNGRN
jgi:nucleoside diphosphate kinase